MAYVLIYGVCRGETVCLCTAPCPAPHPTTLVPMRSRWVILILKKYIIFFFRGDWEVSFFFLILFIFIYLFLAVLGLRFCARAFSNCGKWGPLFIAVRGPLTIVASLDAEHRLQTRRLSNCGSRA